MWSQVEKAGTLANLSGNLYSESILTPNSDNIQVFNIQ